MTKKLLIAIALILPFCVMAQDLKFGYFDRSKIFMSMPETVAASKKLDDFSKNCESELAKMKDEYQRKSSEFIAERDSLPESIKTRRMADIDKVQQGLQSFYQQSQQDIQKLQQDLITPINLKLMNAVKAVGQENNFIYIFDTSANADLMYWSVDKCVDATNLIRTKLNLK
jgi:outer membrane protein